MKSSTYRTKPQMTAKKTMLMKKARQRHPQPDISEEMKAWSAALATETADWPHISQRSFFGFTALYRREKIFALLPRSRNIETANTIAFKVESPAPAVRKQLTEDGRIGISAGECSLVHFPHFLECRPARCPGLAGPRLRRGAHDPKNKIVPRLL